MSLNLVQLLLRELRATDAKLDCGCGRSYNDMAHGDVYTLCAKHAVTLDSGGVIDQWFHLFTQGDIEFQACVKDEQAGRQMCCPQQLNPSFTCPVHTGVANERS